MIGSPVIASTSTSLVLAALFAGAIEDTGITVALRLRALEHPQLLPPPERLTLIDPQGIERHPRLDGAPQPYRFFDAGPGPHRLVVDDPRYRRVEIDGVRDGESRRVELRGSAAIALHLAGGPGAPPITDVALAVYLDRTADQPRGVDRFRKEFPFAFPVPCGAPDARGARVLDGLLPGDFTIVVRAKGYLRAEIEIDELAAGEERRIDVSLRAAPRIRGRVVRTPPETEVAGIPVYALARAEGSLADPFPGWRTIGRARTDGSGGFEVQDLPEGRCILRAALDPNRCADSPALAVTADSVFEDVAITLPSSTWIAGTIRAPAGAPLAACSVQAAREDPGRDRHPRELAALADFAHALLAPVAADGTFRVGPLLPGPVKLRLLLPERPDPESARPDGSDPSGPWLDLGTPVLPDARESASTIDVRERFPAYLRVLVADGGAPALERYHVRADTKGALNSQSAPTAAATGVAEIGWLAPGGWSLSGSAFPGRRFARWLDRVDLAPGEVRAVAVDVAPRLVVLRCLDAATGELLRDAAVSWAPEGRGLPRYLDATTDGAGELRIVVPPGPLRVRRGSAALPVDAPMPALARVVFAFAAPGSWQPQFARVDVLLAGPKPAEVRLHPPLDPEAVEGG